MSTGASPTNNVATAALIGAGVVGAWAATTWALSPPDDISSEEPHSDGPGKGGQGPEGGAAVNSDGAQAEGGSTDSVHADRVAPQDTSPSDGADSAVVERSRDRTGASEGVEETGAANFVLNIVSTPRLLYAVAFAIRFVLLAYGQWQDANFAVKYTDVDYTVFTDASARVVAGESPFRRATYRYTPLLAYMLVPNVICDGIFLAWGKLLFIAADLGVGVLIHRILVMRGINSAYACKLAALYLLNPMAIQVSSRGNADSIVCGMVLLTLFLIMKRRLLAASIVYGLSVHFKIYPIIYAPAYLALLDSDYTGRKGSSWFGRFVARVVVAVVAVVATLGGLYLTRDQFGWPSATFVALVYAPLMTLMLAAKRARPLVTAPIAHLHRTLAALLNRERVTFGVVSGGVFLVLMAGFYKLYGWEFLYETYFYHLGRKDNRHNFSVYFYDIYLGLSAQVSSQSALLAFLPQLGLCLTFGLALGKDLPAALFFQTLTFVTFNKVCTAQYFLWYLSILPLVLPQTNLTLRGSGALLILVWIATQGNWLFWGYRLEFLGLNVFYPLWVASIMFFLANAAILGIMARNHTKRKLFHEAALCPITNAHSR